MGAWKALLLVYRELDVRLPGVLWWKIRVHHVATDLEIADATESFHAFPQLVTDLTLGAVRVEPKIVAVESPLKSLTMEDGGHFWPSPDDTRRELDQFASPGSFDSIFAFWPGHNFEKKTSIPCRGWGLGMGASDWTNRATYAVVANAPSWMWRREAPGEVWLHEWLHGVCHHFASKGHEMPARDADGGELHGYTRSDAAGWTQYYRDLMNGSVFEDGKWLGIPTDAWHEDLSRMV